MADGRGVSNKEKQIEMDNDRGIETKSVKEKRGKKTTIERLNRVRGVRNRAVEMSEEECFLTFGGVFISRGSANFTKGSTSSIFLV